MNKNRKRRSITHMCQFLSPVDLRVREFEVPRGNRFAGEGGQLYKGGGQYDIVCFVCARDFAARLRAWF